MNFLLLFVTGIALAMPEMQLKHEWRACKVDADCVVAGDGCRTCGNLKFVNKKFQVVATQADIAARKVVRTCEACQTSHVKIICEQGLCAEAPRSSGKK